MNTTENYNLKKPEYSDYADISDFNDNMDIIDEELTALNSNSGVTPGTYGGYSSSTEAYNIPSIEVNERGIVIDASNSVLPKANKNEGGWLSRDDYNRLLNAQIYRYVYTYIATEIIPNNTKSITKQSHDELSIVPNANAFFYSVDSGKWYPVPINRIECYTYEKGIYWSRIYIDTNAIKEIQSDAYFHVGDKIAIFSNMPVFEGTDN